MEQKNCLIGIGIIVLIGVLVIIFSNCFGRISTGKLKVTSQPDQVKVIFNHQIYTTPFEIDQLKPGDYNLHAFRTGHLDKDIPIKITARKTTEINIVLEEDLIDKQIIEGAPK